MASPSLRARLLVAAAFWSAGVSVGGFVLVTALMLHYPSWPRILHGAAWTYAAACSVFAAACLVAGFVLVRNSLSSLTRLRERLAAVHAGHDARVGGSYPAEIQPLVDDLNALLTHRTHAVERAIAKAGDLAHGLKTPLAVLFNEAARTHAAGQPELADAMREQIERMRRQVDYHLAHARAAASGAAPGARCSVVESAEGLARTLERLYAARRVSIEVNVPPEHAVRGQREDLDEMLGNLLDNACKWTAARVRIHSVAAGSDLAIFVEDDGPGLAPGMREAVLRRGVRADEAAPGSGFGLAIVRELAELYGGGIALDDSPLGGLRARLTLPAHTSGS